MINCPICSSPFEQRINSVDCDKCSFQYFDDDSARRIFNNGSIHIDVVWCKDKNFCLIGIDYDDAVEYPYVPFNTTEEQFKLYLTFS